MVSTCVDDEYLRDRVLESKYASRQVRRHIHLGLVSYWQEYMEEELPSSTNWYTGVYARRAEVQCRRP